METNLQSEETSALTLYAPFKEGKLISTKETLKNAWLLYKKRASAFLKIMLLLYAAAIMMALSGFVLTLLIAMIKGAALAVIVILFILLIIAFLVISLIAQYSIIVTAAFIDQSLTIKQALSITAKKIKSLLWVGFLAGAITMFGYILFIIPGIIFSVYYSLSLYVALIEDKKGYAALKRSKEIVKGFGFAVAYRGAAWFLLIAIIIFISLIPFLGFIISLVLPFIITPFGHIYFVAIYHNIGSAKEKGVNTDQMTSGQKLWTIILIIITGILFILAMYASSLQKNKAKNTSLHITQYSPTLSSTL